LTLGCRRALPVCIAFLSLASKMVMAVAAHPAAALIATKKNMTVSVERRAMHRSTLSPDSIRARAVLESTDLSDSPSGCAWIRGQLRVGGSSLSLDLS
jgi:hypothetical protein